MADVILLWFLSNAKKRISTLIPPTTIQVSVPLPQLIKSITISVSEVCSTKSLFSFYLISNFATLQHHSKPCTALTCGTGFHYLLICIDCKSVCMSVVLHGTSWGVCSVSHSTLQLFPHRFPLLVNRHISIFISRLPQLWAVKCLQAFFFFSNFFFPLSISLSF